MSILTRWCLKLRFVSNTFWEKIPKSSHCIVMYNKIKLSVILSLFNIVKYSCWNGNTVVWYAAVVEDFAKHISWAKTGSCSKFCTLRRKLFFLLKCGVTFKRVYRLYKRATCWFSKHQAKNLLLLLLNFESTHSRET